MSGKKKKQLPQVPPTALEGTHMLESLKKLPTEQLQDELVAATHAESWFQTVAASFEPKDPLIGPMIMSAGYARLAREIYAMILYLRDEKEDGKNDGDKKKGGYL
jgi:hypothetical protein